MRAGEIDIVRFGEGLSEGDFSSDEFQVKCGPWGDAR